MHKWVSYLLFALGALVGASLVVPVYINQATQSYTFESISDVSSSTVAMVLGASVVRGEPSPVLRERALRALELYRTGKVQKILVSGDDSVAGFDEVSPVRRLLVEEGIPAEDIFLDHAGFDTYSSMYRAREVFLVTDVIIVTQAFHLPRAVFIARRLGLEAQGVVASTGGSLIDRYLREWGASLKAALELTIARVPKYLGPQFPITGDGQETWE
ncbi:MAG: ElyC/SanA/YdcF family protein [Candidatus Adlerbacteria bacterium]|nr:ElyC/SanA/YdcF family protein [Candidatus Adlerbacteria bacterium]